MEELELLVRDLMVGEMVDIHHRHTVLVVEVVPYLLLLLQLLLKHFLVVMD
jgi:hypothetical protein